MLSSTFLTLCRRSGVFTRPLVQTLTTTSAPSAEQDLVVEYLEEDDHGIVVLGINRPKAMNALSKNLVKNLSSAIDAVKFDKNCRVVIIRSHAKGAFCAGADLKERAQMTPAEVGPFVAKGREIIGAWDKLPMPVIAAIDGVALGLKYKKICDGQFFASMAQLDIKLN